MKFLKRMPAMFWGALSVLGIYAGLLFYLNGGFSIWLLVNVLVLLIITIAYYKSKAGE